MSIIKAFNTHFVEFLEDIYHVFPDDNNIRLGKLFIVSLNKMNPTLAIKHWMSYLVVPYRKNIDKGDFGFFVDKDYKQDLGVSSQYDTPKLLEIIELIRRKVKLMNATEHTKIIKYIQNLTKLSELYFKDKDRV